MHFRIRFEILFNRIKEFFTRYLFDIDHKSIFLISEEDSLSKIGKIRRKLKS